MNELLWIAQASEGCNTCQLVYMLDNVMRPTRPAPNFRLGVAQLEINRTAQQKMRQISPQLALSMNQIVSRYLQPPPVPASS
jgi:hypothetical protein